MKRARHLRGNEGKRVHKRLWLLRRRDKIFRCKGRRPFGTSAAGLATNEHTAASVSIGEDRNLVIELPEALDFEENYEATASHFAVLRQAVRQRKTIRRLSFQKLRVISPAAALVLASEVDLWNFRTRGRLVADIDSWSEEIKRLLCEMGYFELLHIRKPDIAWPKGNIAFINFKRGRIKKIDPGPLAKELRIEIEQLVGQPIKKQILFEGLSEAMTNVVQHAYPDATNITLKQWWMSASYDFTSKRLWVTFFDQGAGIPVTLPKAHFFEYITGYDQFWSDSKKIEVAMETGRTSSGQTERGKGLQNLVEFAKSHVKGQLSIYSLCGMYRQNFIVKNNEPVASTSRVDHAVSIGGTLIEWSVVLE